MHEEAREIENINFSGYYTTWLKDSVYPVTNIGAEFLMHIQIFIPVEASFFLKGIQKSSLIIETMIQKIQRSKKGRRNCLHSM